MKKNVLLIIITLFIFSCNKQIIKKNNIESKEKYLFEIGTKKITENQFIKELELAKKNMKLKIEEDNIDDFLNAYVSSLVIQEIAKAENLDKTDTFNIITENFQNQLLVEIFSDNLKKNIKEPSALDINNFYNKNKDKYFAIPEKVHIKSILAQDSETIYNIYNLLKHNVTFDSIILSGKYNIKAGDIGIITKGTTFPEIEEVAFNLKPKEYSSVIETKLGYHIIYCVKKYPKKYITLNKIKKDIYKLIIKTELKKKLDDRVNEFKKHHVFLINKPKLNKILGNIIREE